MFEVPVLPTYQNLRGLGPLHTEGQTDGQCKKVKCSNKYSRFFKIVLLILFEFSLFTHVPSYLNPASHSE